MASYNKVIIIGNLARDTELRQTQSGTSVMNGAVAINEKYTATNGEKRENAIFVDVCAFGRSAENIAKYFHKGDPIFIEGRLRQEQWTDKQSGQTRSKLSVYVERFEFLRTKTADGQQFGKTEQFAADDLDDDDVAF